jgi:hypothetical protein
MEGAPLRRAFFCFERLPRTRLFHLDISLSASTTRIRSPLHGQRSDAGWSAMLPNWQAPGSIS